VSIATSRRAEVRRRLQETGGRGRKLRGLAEILAPYRWRVLAMFVALVVATAAALAPAPLAKLAIDQGIRHHDTGTLDVIVVVFLVSAILYAVATYAQTYLVGWVGQRALQSVFSMRSKEYLTSSVVSSPRLSLHIQPCFRVKEMWVGSSWVIFST